MATIPGLTTAMLVALGEKNVKTVEDVADCATDDLLGWNERKDKETIHHEGILDGFNLSKQEIEDLILAARVKAGWIDEADLAPEPEAEEAEFWRRRRGWRNQGRRRRVMSGPSHQTLFRRESRCGRTLLSHSLRRRARRETPSAAARSRGCACPSRI